MKILDQLLRLPLLHNEVLVLRLIAALVVLASVFALGFAYTAQYGFNMPPCILCLYQRWPYRVAIGIGVFAFVMVRYNPQFARMVLMLAPIAFVVDAAIGFFQVGVEQKWWHGFTGCSAPDLRKLSGPDLYAAIQSAPAVSCDVIQFELFGISMAGYNAIFALGLALTTALALRYLPLKNARRQG